MDKRYRSRRRFSLANADREQDQAALRERRSKISLYRWQEAPHPCIHRFWELVDTQSGQVLFSISPLDIGPPDAEIVG